MFGGHGAHADGIPQHQEASYRDYDREYAEREMHHRAAEAHHPEGQVTGVRENLTMHGFAEADIGHLDETPYEHSHSDFDARFIENERLPHHEVEHDGHGIEVVVE